MGGRSLDIEMLRRAIQSASVEWQRHALERMLERGILREQVKEVLLTGERIEDYPEDYPWPSALFLGVVEDRHLHVVVALDPVTGKLAIITAYEPSTEHFETDLKTRKR